MKVNFLFKWYDMWVGLFLDKPKSRLYIFPIPMLGVVVDWTKKDQRDVIKYDLPCPKCGAVPEKAKLTILSGKFKSSRLPFRSDGFKFDEARFLETQDCIVQCLHCFKVFYSYDALPCNKS